MRLQDLPAELLKACPSADARWREHAQWWGTEEPGAFNDVAVFAHHVVENYASGKTDEFLNFFGLLERMIREGDRFLVELATVGLIEDIQNIASHQPFGYRVFEPWLGLASRREWARIEATWSGKNSLAEVIRDEIEPKR